MKAKPLKFIDEKGYIPCEISETTHLQLHMPGPFSFRLIPVITSGTRKGTGNWTWNGDIEKPTLKPSILTTANFLTEKGLKDYQDWADKGFQGAKDIRSMDNFETRKVVCHTWITDGKVIFLDDCTHEFKGQTVDLLNVEDFKY